MASDASTEPSAQNETPGEGAARAGGERRVRRRGRSRPGEGSALPPVAVEVEATRRSDDAPEPARHSVSFPEGAVDADVQKVIRRLARSGHEAYLVGGCVRDLLLGRMPKDFDVATSAHPEEVRELFRNSRVIGRRFRLVHVLFGGGKFFEVATFRRNPQSEGDPETDDLLIKSDNAFGNAYEDAMRRDFTVNALFYDIEARQVLDWVGGMRDVDRRLVHTIGAPEVRFREDPVRMLRAIKFAGRLELGISPDVYDALVLCREELSRAARPRLAEEILRLLRGGQSRRSVFLAWETGILDVLLPELSALLTDAGDEDGARGRVFRALGELDRLTAEHQKRGAGADDGAIDDTALWGVLLLEPLKEACDGARDRGEAAGELLEPIAQRLAIPRRAVDGMRRIMALLPRVVAGRGGRFTKTDVFRHVADVALIDLAASGGDADGVLRLSGGRAEPAPRQRRRR